MSEFVQSSISSKALADYPKDSPMLVKKESSLFAQDSYISFGEGDQQHDKTKELIKLDKVEDAIAMIDAQTLQTSSSYSLRADCLLKLKRNEEALQSLEKALELDNNNANALLIKGIILLQQSDSTGMDLIEQSLKIEKSVRGYNALGNGYYLVQKLAEAIEAWSEALKIDSKYDQAYHNIGLALLELGKTKDAIYYLNRAVELSPKNPLYRCNRGVANIQLDKTAALEDLESARELLKDCTSLTVSNIQFIEERITMIQSLEQSRDQFKDLLGKLKMDDAKYKQYVGQLESIENQSQIAYFKAFIDKTNQSLKNLEDQQKSMHDVLEKNGDLQRYELKLALDKLETSADGMIQKEYYCTFYWTILQYLTAYQQLSVGAFQPGPNADQFFTGKKEDIKKKFLEAGAKYVGDKVKKFTEKIPVIGDIIGYLDDAISYVFKTRAENQFKNRISAIKHILLNKKGERLEDFFVLQLSLQTAAYKLCILQRDKILDRVQKQEFQKQYPTDNSDWQQILNSVQKFKDDILQNNKTDMFEGEASSMALEQVVVVMIYLFTQYELVINNEDSFSDIIIQLITQEKAKKQAIKMIASESKQNEVKQPITNPLPPVQREEQQKQDKDCLSCMIY